MPRVCDRRRRARPNLRACRAARTPHLAAPAPRPPPPPSVAPHLPAPSSAPAPDPAPAPAPAGRLPAPPARRASPSSPLRPLPSSRRSPVCTAPVAASLALSPLGWARGSPVPLRGAAVFSSSVALLGRSPPSPPPSPSSSPIVLSRSAASRLFPPHGGDTQYRHGGPVGGGWRVGQPPLLFLLPRGWGSERPRSGWPAGGDAAGLTGTAAASSGFRFAFYGSGGGGSAPPGTVDGGRLLGRP